MTVEIQDEKGSDLTLTQITAHELHDMGLNVFPLIHGTKKPCFKWSKLQLTRLHATHNNYGLNSIFGGRCNIGVMCGHTSGNLFILDLETPEAFEYHLAQLRLRKIPIFASETARGGHIWLRCADGEVSNIASGTIPDGELRGSNSYIVAPESIHPSGVIYSWYIREVSAPPLVSTRQIDWLVDRNNAPVKLELVTKSEKKHQGYSRMVQDYLDNGHKITEGSRNTEAFKATCGLIGSGIDEDQAYELIVPVAVTSGLSENEATDIVRKAYKNYGSTEPNNQKRQVLDWECAFAFAENHNWSGRSGTTDHSVMLAFVERARIGTNGSTFRASQRELAQLARCTQKTVQVSITRLKAEGFICQEGQDKLSGATLWKFSEAVISEGLTLIQQNFLISTSVKQKGLSTDVVIRKTDALERGALGQTGWRIYQTLLSSESPMRVKDICDKAGLTKNQVYNFLSTVESGNNILVRSKLVEKVGKGWIAHPATDEELDEMIAIPAGKLGNGEKRRQQFASDRSIDIGKLILTARYKYDRANLQTVGESVFERELSQVQEFCESNSLSKGNVWYDWIESMPMNDEIEFDADYELEMSST